MQSQMVPPLPAFNKLLQLCSKQPDAMETVHQVCLSPMRLVQAAPPPKQMF